jgi:hypothetical protein
VAPGLLGLRVQWVVLRKEAMLVARLVLRPSIEKIRNLSGTVAFQYDLLLTSSRILDNPFFVDYQLLLANSAPKAYNPPTSSIMRLEILPVLHNQLQSTKRQEMKYQSNLTMLLDGWKDPTGNSIYALMLQNCGLEFQYYFDHLNLVKKRHKAELILPAIEECWVKNEIDPHKLIAFCTDSPNVMLKLRRILNLKYPWIVKIRCSLHDFNNVLKWMMKHPLVKLILSQTMSVVNYFGSSYFYAEVLDEWRDGIKARRVNL